jgi:hypothetical protein
MRSLLGLLVVPWLLCAAHRRHHLEHSCTVDCRLRGASRAQFPSVSCAAASEAVVGQSSDERRASIDGGKEREREREREREQRSRTQDTLKPRTRARVSAGGRRRKGREAVDPFLRLAAQPFFQGDSTHSPGARSRGRAASRGS